MKKYTIYSTKEDYEKLYEEIRKIAEEHSIDLKWDKIKEANYDSIVELLNMLRRTAKRRD